MRSDVHFLSVEVESGIDDTASRNERTSNSENSPDRVVDGRLVDKNISLVKVPVFALQCLFGHL